MAESCTAESSEFSDPPALKIAELLRPRRKDSGGSGQPSGSGDSDADVDTGLYAALFVEIADGSTVRFVRVTRADSLSARLSRDDAKKVPSVLKALKVLAKTYTDIQEPAQWQLKYLLIQGHDPDARRVRLSDVRTPQVDLEDALVKAEHRAHGLSVAYGSQPLDVGGEPMGVAAAACLSDLVLGRVVLLQLLGFDSSDRLTGRLLLPAVCDAEVDGREAVDKFYRCLATSTLLKERSLYGECKESGEGKTGWERLAGIVDQIQTSRGVAASEDLLRYFLGTAFDHSVCPPTMALTDVADVMVSRGFAWVASDHGAETGDRQQHLLALQGAAKERGNAIWSLPRGLLDALTVEDDFYFTGELSDFPALLLAQLLEWLSKGHAETSKSDSTRGTGRFFAALTTRAVDGDTVRLVPVLSDVQVQAHIDIAGRRRLSTVKQAISKATGVIINCPTTPEVQLATWSEGEGIGGFMPMDSCSILAQIYAIDAPEVKPGGMTQRKGTETVPNNGSAVYGSEQLDGQGQPLGVAAARAISELLLGRVVLVQDLDRDCYDRMIARVFVPSVSDRQLDGGDNFDTYFRDLVLGVKGLMPGKLLVPPESNFTGAKALTATVRKLRSAMDRKQLQATVVKCLCQTRTRGMPGLLDASDEMLRRGLAIIYRGKDVNYAGRLEDLCRLTTRAQVRGCGRWGLPAYCQVDPKEYRWQKGANRRDGHSSSTLKRKQRVAALLGATE